LLALSTPVTTVWAQLPASEEDAAQQYKKHMAQGVRFYDEKNYAAAIAEFEAAYQAKPKANPLLNIALCQKELFQYPKAVATLERAVRDHGDGMTDRDKKDTNAALTDLRGRVAWVKLEITPTDAKVEVDGEAVAADQLASLPLSPGPHKVVVRADGHDPEERQISVASGNKNTAQAFALKANAGHVFITATDARTELYVDQKLQGREQWDGWLAPGVHVITFARPGEPPASAYAMQLDVKVGETYKLAPGVGGKPLANASLPLPPPPPTDKSKEKKKDPNAEKRGPFVLGTASLLMPVVHPGGIDAEPNAGGAGGLRAGYRVNDVASFDGLIEYGNVGVRSKPGSFFDGYEVKSVRFGPDLRLMTTGNRARFYGVLGGGGCYDILELQLPVSGVKVKHEGLAAYLLTELGFELDFGGVLAGLAAQGIFQSSRAMGGSEVYPSDTLVWLGGGLRIGYGFW
jgi:hypothetical protein